MPSRWGSDLWLIIEMSFPPNLARHLYNVAQLIPRVRHTSGTATPHSASFRIAMIGLSVNRDPFTVKI